MKIIECIHNLTTNYDYATLLVNVTYCLCHGEIAKLLLNTLQNKQFLAVAMIYFHISK